jgi:ketosteroid isomerase-like protein
VTQDADTALRGIQSFNQRGSEAFVEFLVAEAHPEFFFHIQEDLPNGGVWEGIDGCRSMMDQWMEAWAEFEVVPGEVVEGAEGRLLIPVEQRAVTSGGMELRGDFQYVWVAEDGKLREIHLFADPKQARRAAGIGD